MSIPKSVPAFFSGGFGRPRRDLRCFFACLDYQVFGRDYQTPIPSDDHHIGHRNDHGDGGDNGKR
jgi:hypothetical protein